MEITTAETMLRLGASLLCGAAIGYERERASRPAGLRTQLLVSLASATFNVFSASAQVTFEEVNMMLTTSHKQRNTGCRNRSPYRNGEGACFSRVIGLSPLLQVELFNKGVRPNSLCRSVYLSVTSRMRPSSWALIMPLRLSMYRQAAVMLVSSRSSYSIFPNCPARCSMSPRLSRPSTQATL